MYHSGCILLPVWAHRLSFGLLLEVSTCDAAPKPARKIRVHDLDCILIVRGFICFVSRDEAASSEDTEEMLTWVGIRSWSGTQLYRFFFVFLSLFILFVPARSLRADSAPFDLIGPVVEAKVSRGGKSLPISAVPNLQAGDRLWIQADSPSDQ
jgi:hypothetical protein